MGTYWIINTFVPILQLFILVISVLYFFKSRWFRRFAGEMLVHILTKIHLDKTKYHVLKNVTFPVEDGKIQIDHIIVSRYGVFVIETKNLKGLIFGDPHQRTWTQKIFKYTKKFQSPIHQNYKHVKTIQSLLAMNDQQVFSVIVFVGNNTFKTDMPDSVMHGTRLIKYINSKDQPVFFDADVKMILSKIEAERLTPSWKAAKASLNYVRQIVNVISIRRISLRSKMTIPILIKDNDSNQDIDNEPAFTDSWQNKSLLSEDIDSEFKDRAFQ
jgi:hypothetical protein